MKVGIYIFFGEWDGIREQPTLKNGRYLMAQLHQRRFFRLPSLSPLLSLNILTGYTLVYRKVFRIGDRMKIRQHIGNVIERRLLVTRLQSTKNEEIIVPNSEILNSPVINYSSLAKQQGLILHLSVEIGYEVSWRKVEAILLEAVSRTPDLLKPPQAFCAPKGARRFLRNLGT